MPSSIPVNVSASGNTTLANASTTQAIYVVGFLLNSGGAVSVTLKDSSGTAYTGPLNLPAAGSTIESQLGFSLAPGVSLVINLSAAVQVSGYIVYDIYPA